MGWLVQAYRVKYIETSSPMPLYHVMGYGFIASYALSWYEHLSLTHTHTHTHEEQRTDKSNSNNNAQREKEYAQNAETDCRELSVMYV